MFVVTFIATLMVPLHVAIFTGVGLSIMLYLRKASQPSLVEYEFNKEGNLAEAARNAQRQHPSISIVHVEGDLFFGAAELFRTQIQRTCSDREPARHHPAPEERAPSRCHQRHGAGGTGAHHAGERPRPHRQRRRQGRVSASCATAACWTPSGAENFFMGSAQNPNLSTRNALKRAQQIIGVKDAEVQIFYDPRFSSSGKPKE